MTDRQVVEEAGPTTAAPNYAGARPVTSTNGDGTIAGSNGNGSETPPGEASGASASSVSEKTSVLAGAPAAGTAPRKKLNPIAMLVLALVVAIAAYYGVRWYVYNKSHVSTDDAHVGGDIYQVSAKVSGYLTSVPVSTNQLVRKGDLLAQIDPREYQQNLDQAEANLAALAAAARSSGAQLTVTRQTTGAGVSQATAGVNAARAGVDVARSRVATANTGVASAEAALRAAEAGEITSQHAIGAARAQVNSARAALRSAEAGVVSARANETRVAADAHRSETLVREGAIAQQQYDAAVAQLAAATAARQQAEQAVADAQARVDQAQANQESATSAVTQAAAAVQQARVGVLQARDQVNQAKAAVGQSLAQLSQAQGALQGAESAPAQVAVTSGAAQSNVAKIRQAQAAVDEARLQLSYTEVRAPADGYVSEKNVEPGQLVQPGQALMAVVPLTGTYVDANFKETQLQQIRVGQPAEVTVDAYPGKIFHGHVRSIASATGATFSLLPPENATGNFVKVVQRVTVRISIDQGEDPQHLMRLGMSTTVTVNVR